MAQHQRNSCLPPSSSRIAPFVIEFFRLSQINTYFSQCWWAWSLCSTLWQLSIFSSSMVLPSSLLFSNRFLVCIPDMDFFVFEDRHAGKHCSVIFQAWIRGTCCFLVMMHTDHELFVLLFQYLCGCWRHLNSSGAGKDSPALSFFLVRMEQSKYSTSIHYQSKPSNTTISSKTIFLKNSSLILGLWQNPMFY